MSKKNATEWWEACLYFHFSTFKLNRLLILFSIGFSVSCNFQNDEKITENIKIKRDTIKNKECDIDSIHLYSTDENDYNKTDYYIQERLPERIQKLDFLNKLELRKEFKIESRINPLYFEADFNGDGNLDIALQVSQIETEKVGFVIIHGETNEMFIIGAGTKVKNGLSDDINYIDEWKVNRDKINESGVGEDTRTGEKSVLILKNPSLTIEKSEVGGGQVYWNGKEYVYFHQAC